MEATERCGICNTVKFVYEFNKNASAADGYDNRCKPCKVEYNKEWVNNNREHYNEQKQNYYNTNPQAKISNNIHKRLNSILRRGCYNTRTE